MSQITFRLEGAGWSERIAMIARMDALIIAGNIRVLFAEPLDSRCSTFQHNIACAMFGVECGCPQHKDEQKVVATAYGSWEQELGVVMEAAIDVLQEWEAEQDEETDDAKA